MNKLFAASLTALLLASGSAPAMAEKITWSYSADLASLDSIREAADRFLADHDRLHVLINNAGVSLNHRSVTVDGVETTFAVNHLAPFLLTNLLLELLKQSVPSRVVNVTSTAFRERRLNRLPY